MSLNKKTAVLKWSSVVTSALLVLVLLVLSWIYTTETGLQWLVERSAHYQPQALKIGQVSGTLHSQVKLTELEWQQEALKVRLQNIEVDCQWLHLIDGLVACDVIKIASIDISDSSVKKSSDNDGDLPELPTIKLPIAVKAETITIGEINFQQIDRSDITKQQVDEFSLKKLALDSSKVSFSILKLSYAQHDITITGHVDMRKKWPHQLTTSVVGPELSLNLSSKGKMAKLAQLQLNMQLPNQMQLSSDWYYKQGLFLKRGNLQANKQILALAQQSIFIEQAKANFELDWPKLTSSLQVETSWQALEKIKLNVKGELPNVLDWQTNTLASVQLSSEVAEKALQAYFKQPLISELDNKQSVPQVTWPLLANIELKLNNGAVTLNSNEIKFGQLTAALQGSFNVNDPVSDGFIVKAQLNAPKINLHKKLAFAGINAHLQLENQHSIWHIASKGKVSNITIDEVNAKNLDWAFDFNRQWQANVKADYLTINDVEIAVPVLTVSGVAENHQLKFNANFAENRPVKLSLNGNVLNKDNNPINFESDFSQAIWQINQLTAEVQNQQQAFIVNAKQIQLSKAKQTIQNLCLKGRGAMCINANNQRGQWQTNLAFEQWSLAPMVDKIRAWLPEIPRHYPQQVAGFVTGELTLMGKSNQLEKLNVDISLPRFNWLASDIDLTGEGLTIKSEQLSNFTTITTQWQSINTRLNIPQWQSEIAQPSGAFIISVSPDLQVSYDLTQAGISVSIPDINKQKESALFKTLLTIEQLKIDGNWQPNNLTARLAIDLPAEDNITAKLTSEWPIIDSAKISGALALNLQQFDWLKKWQKRIDKIELNLAQNFAISGSWQQPLLQGEGSLAIKHLVIDEYGLDISDSNVKVNSNQDSILLTGELKNPQGALTISGTAKLSQPLTASLNIAGQQVTLVNNNDNKLIVSPKLKANYQDQHLKVDGHIVVDQADIKITSLPKPAIAVSDDQVIVDEKDITLKDSPFSHNVALTIATGNNVKISGFGLSSDIEGNLSSMLISGQPLVLNGRLDLTDGKFEAYKQILTIEQGQLIFLGSAENPSIQFRAVRQVDDIKVGIIADGTIHAPRLTLFSEPAMADENVLSLLITGRSLASLSQQEGNALTNAAISLGVESANKLVQKIGDQLGLKDVAFTSKSATSGNSTRVDIAAKINDRLNVGYGTNIDSDNSIQTGWIIEYKLSPSISFEATSGEEISANINYKKQFSSTKEKEKEKEKEKD